MTHPPATSFDRAIAAHRAGDLAAAEPLYRAALSADGADPRATQMLGVLVFQTGRVEPAIELLQRAAGLAPESAECHGNLGVILAAAGRMVEATAAYRRAVAIKPGFADAHVNLGNALRAAGDADAAAGAYRRAIDACPGLAAAHHNLGLLMADQGDLPGATAAVRHACGLRPDGGPEHLDLAHLLLRGGDLPAAAAAYDRAVARRPGWPEAWNNLGVWLHAGGRDAEAADALSQALAARPDYAEAHCNLGSVWRQAGRLADAIGSYRRAVDLRPDYAEAMSNLGSALERAGEVDEAVATLRRAIDLRPDLSEAHNNLGNALKATGDLDGALACWARVTQLRPADAEGHSNLVYTLLYHPAADPRVHLDAALAWGRRHADPLTAAAARLPVHVRPAGQRLRVGYVAPDFRDHCQSFFTMPLLANHDRDQVEVVCYADVATPDHVTARLRQHADLWRETVGLSDAALADQIRNDRVDVLVDLTVHMANHRLLAFARRPAPVQVTWLGYPGTTGVAAIDYRLSDPHLDPPGGDRDALYAERTVRLPDTFWCYDPLTDGPAVGDLPAATNGCVTFGCLNNFCKVTDATLALWAAVLARVPGSRLLLLAPAGSARRRVLDVLGRAAGINAGRVEFVARQSRAAYLDTYRRIDVGLDTVPYAGHTTSLDAYWMGVPVVTRVGLSAAARGGWSQLSNLGLRQLAAHDDDQFVTIAAALAADLDALAARRASLRQRLLASPLCDGPRFARHVEAAYRQMCEAQRRQAA